MDSVGPTSHHGPRKGNSACKRSARQHRARMKAIGSVSLAEVRRAAYRGLISEKMKPFAIEAEQELSAILVHLGGRPSAVEDAIARDASRLGMIARALLAFWLREPGDLDTAKAISNLLGQRSRMFGLLGLQAREKEIDLHAYLAAKSAPSP